MSGAPDERPKKRGEWPKGPFPEKWAFPAVEKRLTGAWAMRQGAWDGLLASGARRVPPDDDPLVRVFEGGSEDAIAALRDAGTSVFGWAAPNARPIAGARVALPTSDVLDALVAVAVAGPHHGIGNRTLIRFLVQARAMAAWSVRTVGEDLLVLEMKAKGPESAQLLADRLPHVAPTIARDDLSARLIEGGELVLDYSPPR